MVYAGRHGCDPVIVPHHHRQLPFDPFLENYRSVEAGVCTAQLVTSCRVSCHLVARLFHSAAICWPGPYHSVPPHIGDSPPPCVPSRGYCTSLLLPPGGHSSPPICHLAAAGGTAECPAAQCRGRRGQPDGGCCAGVGSPCQPGANHSQRRGCCLSSRGVAGRRRDKAASRRGDRWCSEIERARGGARWRPRRRRRRRWAGGSSRPAPTSGCPPRYRPSPCRAAPRGSSSPCCRYGAEVIRGQMRSDSGRIWVR